MDTPPHYQPIGGAKFSVSALRWFMYLMLVGMGLFVLAALGVMSYLRLSPDTAALRNAVQEVSRAEWRKVVALNIGDATFLLARTGLSVARIPEEPRALLSAIRSCEVGVYETGDGNSADRAAMLIQADKTMNRRGWERIVGVVDGGDLVAVYVPRKMNSPRSVRSCVLVFDERQLVLVSAKGNLEPIIELVLRQKDFRKQLPLLANR